MPQTISTEPLAQMLRSIAFQKRSGMLYVEQLGGRNAERGVIYFENGRALRAKSGQETGRAAIQKISAWKQITCSFQGMSRPFSAITRDLKPSREQAEERPLARRSPAEGRHHTDALHNTQDLQDTDHLKEVKIEPRKAQISGDQTLLEQEMKSSATQALLEQEPRSPKTRALTEQETERVVVARRPILSAPVRSNQPLILHGERLEEYTPEPPARPSRHIERWTTHLNPPAPEMPTRVPVTPRLGPLPGEEVLPGRMAIFKARAMITTAQAIQRMERRERIIFILLDGRRTIQDIARLTHQPESDVEQTLMSLTKRGYTQYIRG
jgi:hypothetical protein